jgi:hypothetical protein
LKISHSEYVLLIENKIKFESDSIKNLGFETFFADYVYRD